MAPGSHIETSRRTGRRGALQAALALLLLAAVALSPTATAALPHRARPWLGCYRITVGDSYHDLVVRLTDEPDGYDGFRVEFSRAPDREDMMGGWKPLTKAGFHISVGNGVEGWRADLRGQRDKLVGESTRFDDTGRAREGPAISAVRMSCRHDG